MKLVFLKLKQFFVLVIFLTQVFSFANINNTQEQNSNISNEEQVPSIPQAVQKNWQIIQGYNTEIQNLLIIIPKINDNEERDTAALRLAQLIEPTVYKKLQQALDNLEKIVVNNNYSINTRIAALEALSKHTLPNYNLDYVIMDISNYPKLRIATNKAREKLKENHIQTGKRFSKLHNLTSPSVIEAWSLMWIIMYKDNSDIERKLYQLLSSHKINIKKIAALIAKKLMADYGFRFRPKTAAGIRWLLSESTFEETDSTNLPQQPKNNGEDQKITENQATTSLCSRRAFRTL